MPKTTTISGITLDPSSKRGVKGENVGFGAYKLVIVDEDGNGDYTQIKDACDYVTGLSEAGWTILVFSTSATYYCSPFTIPDGCTVMSMEDGAGKMGRSFKIAPSKVAFGSVEAWDGDSPFITMGDNSVLANLDIDTSNEDVDFSATAAGDVKFIQHAQYATIRNCYINGGGIGCASSSRLDVVYQWSGGAQIVDCWISGYEFNGEDSNLVYHAGATASIVNTVLDTDDNPTNVVNAAGSGLYLRGVKVTDTDHYVSGEDDSTGGVVVANGESVIVDTDCIVPKVTGSGTLTKRGHARADVVASVAGLTAMAGTIVFNSADSKLYVNTDGGTTWVATAALS